jgi:hypothetical protein
MQLGKQLGRNVLKGLSSLLILSLVLAFTAHPSFAATPARSAKWVVSVTYQNLGTKATPIQVLFYPEGNSTPVTYDPLSGGTLAAGAGESFFVGNVSGLAGGFQGNAVMSASEPLAATVVQFSQEAGYKMRLLFNGFSNTSVSNQYLVATALFNKFARTTIFSIQNTESTDIKATVNFYDADNAGNLAATKEFNIPANSSKYIEMDDVNDTGLTGKTTFNGSAIVVAKTAAGANANVVASAGEYYTDRAVATSFEGLPLSAAATTLYMATALCQRFNLDTFYAVQNASLTDNAKITVTYKNLDGSTKATDGPYDIGPGQKRSIITCSPSDKTNMAGFTGAAVITSQGAAIAAIGKAQNSTAAGSAGTADVLTAFLGAKEGASKLALPFVRWASDARFAASTGGQQRTFIAIQNLESSEVKVDVEYYNSSGTLVATHPLTIAANSKGNSDAKTAGALGKGGMNADEFGYYPGNKFGGAVIVRANAANPNAKLIAIARVQHPGAGEDYNAVPIP